MTFVLVFAAALAFYALTLAPTVAWGDSAGLSLAAVQGYSEFINAASHPFFTVVGRLFVALPGDPGRNVNFEAAMFGALCVSLVYGCARLLGASKTAAATGAAALCVSHAFWLHSVIAEVYT